MDHLSLVRQSPEARSGAFSAQIETWHQQLVGAMEDFEKIKEEVAAEPLLLSSRWQAED